MKPASAFAPAKINLFLHVGATACDGYHPLTSWMVFADLGDTIHAEPSAALEFDLKGRFSSVLTAEGDNLVTRARDALLAQARGPVAPFKLTLDKTLPVASGMGGGSSDAAATLRLLGKPMRVSPDEQIAIAKRLGSDVPACLYAQSVMARGRGEILSPAPQAPPLPAVLVNPGVAVSTAQIFSAFDAGEPGDLRDGDPPKVFEDVGQVVEFLSRQRNDLQDHAIGLQPVIGEVIAALRQAPESLLVRMTGSGATVFAICSTIEDANALASRIRRQNPQWWCEACHLA